MGAPNKAKDKTELKRIIENEYLTGNQRINNIRHILQQKYDLKYTEQHIRVIIAEIKRELKERFAKDYEQDFQFFKENLLRLLHTAFEQEDRKEQRFIIQDMMKLAGMDVQRIETTIMTDNPEEVMNKLNNLLK